MKGIMSFIKNFIEFNRQWEENAERDAIVKKRAKNVKRIQKEQKK